MSGRVIGLERERAVSGNVGVKIGFVTDVGGMPLRCGIGVVLSKTVD